MSGKVSDNLGRSSGLTKSATVTTQPKSTSSSDPETDTNPSGGVGHIHLNSDDGELFVCYDATTDENMWLGTAGTSVRPIPYYGNLGVFCGGMGAARSNVIDEVSIASAGNASDFGDLTVARRTVATSNKTRGVAMGGNAP